MPEEIMVDNAILTQCGRQWSKVAMVIVKTRSELAPSHDLGDEIYEVIAGRIAQLVKAGKLESRGELSNWRRSEVRLPGARG